MKQETTSKALTGIGIFAAAAASLCCITPLLALLAGASGAASSLSWLEAARPYLIGFALAALAFAWYRSLSNKQNTVCGPDGACVVEKKSFLDSRTFLIIITITAIALISFPYYAKVFHPKPKVQAATVATVDNKQQVKFTIQGMTCEGCEEHVNNELSKVDGVMTYKTSYASKSSLVTFDKSKVDVKTVEAAINKTGYTVKDYKTIIEKK